MIGRRHAALREGTNALHSALDEAVMTSGYFASLAGYGQYLARLYGFQVEFDEATERCGGDWSALWGTDKHGGWLRSDMAALGLTIPPVIAPAAERGLVLASKSSLLGALYVVVGSGLGARVLLPRARSLPLPAGAGSLYLESISRKTDWRAFLSFLEAAESICENDMIDSARTTFERAHWHMREGVPA